MAALLQHSRLDPDPPRMRVLIVDDDVDGCQSTALLIQMKGHETRMAFSGRDAIHAIKTFSPELVLLDVSMPDMDGIDVAKTVRRMPDPEAPAIAAMTGFSDLVHRQRCAEAGFDYFLPKPLAANDYDYLLWITSRPARLRDAFRILQSEPEKAFYNFAVSQLEFGWLVLNFAAAQEESLKQRSFKKVNRMQDRTAKWLKMAGGFTPEEKVALQIFISGLQSRLKAMRGDKH